MTYQEHRHGNRNAILCGMLCGPDKDTGKRNHQSTSGLLILEILTFQVLDEFLTSTYETSETVDCDPRLAIISSLDNHSFDRATRPPVSAFTSPFLQRSLHQIAADVRRIAKRESSDIDNIWFVVLDERSNSDKTALLVQINDQGDDGEEAHDVESLRASFEVVNYTLNSLNVGVTSFVEQQDRATDDVLRHPDTTNKPRGGSCTTKEAWGLIEVGAAQVELGYQRRVHRSTGKLSPHLSNRRIGLSCPQGTSLNMSTTVSQPATFNRLNAMFNWGDFSSHISSVAS